MVVQEDLSTSASLTSGASAVQGVASISPRSSASGVAGEAKLSDGLSQWNTGALLTIISGSSSGSGGDSSIWKWIYRQRWINKRICWFI